MPPGASRPHHTKPNLRVVVACRLGRTLTVTALTVTVPSYLLLVCFDMCWSLSGVQRHSDGERAPATGVA